MIFRSEIIHPGVLSRKHSSYRRSVVKASVRFLLIGILPVAINHAQSRTNDEIGSVSMFLSPSMMQSSSYRLDLIAREDPAEATVWKSYGVSRPVGFGHMGVSKLDAVDFLQQKPQSCGLSALRYWLAMHGQAVSEAAIEKRVAGRQHVVTANAYERGYSLADLLYAANTFGYSGSARWLFKSSVAHLEFPLIILLTDERQPHFLVLLDNRMAFDPATGYREMTIKTLLEDSASSVVALHLSAVH
jgi:hypothetical protein